MSNLGIGGTFVVNTIDDPISVIAQYAPNDNPTSSQIHTTWQSGDLYMRTKSTEDGATWSPWHRIVGESGDETDYKFNISQNKTSSRVTTAPSNCYYDEWQDNPITATQAYPYLWMQVTKKTWNDATQDYDSGTPRYVRVTGEESIEYSVEGALNTIKVGTGQTSTLVSCTYTFYQKPAVSSTRSTVSCYYAVYLRSGNTFSLLSMSTGYNNHGSGTSVTVNSNVPYKSGSVVYNAVVIYIFPSSYYSTSPESQNYMAKKEIPIVKDGDTAFVVDLENEMVSIEADEYGSTTKQYNFSSAVRAFYGATNVIDDCTVTVSANDPDIDALFNSGTKNLEVLIPVGTNTYDTVTVTITVTHSTYGTRTATFIISKISAGTDAFIQELLPSLNEISFARQADKTLSPPNRDLTLSFKKTKGNETTTQTIAESGLTIRWSVASMPTTSRGGTAWGSGNVTGITWNSNTMTIANSIAESNIYIACFNSSGTLVDRETIPIIKDGQHGNDGDDAAAAFVSTNAITIQCNSNGSVSSSQTTSINFSMKVGTHNATVSGHTSPSTLPTGVSIIDDAPTACRITVGTSATASGIKGGVTFTITGTYNSKTYTANVTVALIGACKGGEGSRGKIGRFFYYEGEWTDYSDSATFVVTDAQAPYFHSNNSFWVFNPETNGTYTKSAMGTPSSQVDNWELMTDDFKYLITEAIFGQYAHFGASIINGDYLLSQYGYMRGFGDQRTAIDDSTQYIYADPNDMFGEATWNLQPSQDPNMIVNYLMQSSVTNTSYERIATISSFRLVKDRWYTMQLTGYGDYDNNPYTLNLALGTSTSNIFANTVISIKGCNTGRSDKTYDAYITFKATQNASSCYVYTKVNNSNADGYILDILVRYAQFVPNLCIDMKSGKLAANNIIARGALYADSFVYTMNYGNSNNDTINVGDESIVNLSTRAVGTTIKLPSPSTCKGRRIEVFSFAESWYITWVGANSGSLFKAAYGSGLDYGVTQAHTHEYMLVYSDGQYWWCLKEE